MTGGRGPCPEKVAREQPGKHTFSCQLSAMEKRGTQTRAKSAARRRGLGPLCLRRSSLWLLLSVALLLPSLSLSADDSLSTEAKLRSHAFDTDDDSTGSRNTAQADAASSSEETHSSASDTKEGSSASEDSASETHTQLETESFLAPPPPPELALKPPAKLQCGNWQEAYARFHRESLAKARDALREAAGSSGASERRRRGGKRPVNTSFLAPGGPKYAVYDCMGAGRLHNTHCQGFGDMIRGVISTFVFALLSHRVFLINAPAIQHGFASPFIDWRFPLTRPISLYQGTHRHYSHYSLSTGLSVYSLNVMAQAKSSAKTAQVLLDAVEDPADVVVVRAHRGILHLLLSEDKRFNWAAPFLRKTGLQDPVQAFACLMRFLLQPSEAAMRRVAPQLKLLQQPRTTTVGIHIRTGDGIWGRRMPEDFAEAHMPLFFCADMVTKRRLKWLPRAPHSEPRSVVWFVASDSSHLKQAMREKWGDRVIVTPFRPSHINKKYHNKSEMYSVIEEAIGEWALFAQCQYHVFRISGWSLTAALLTANPSKVTNFIFGGGNNRPKDSILQRTCNSTEYSPRWLDMSNKWGGL